MTCVAYVGGVDSMFFSLWGPTVKYHPCFVDDLTRPFTAARAVAGGQFVWGGRLRNCNGGAGWGPQCGRVSDDERKRRKAPGGERDGCAWERRRRLEHREIV